MKKIITLLCVVLLLVVGCGNKGLSPQEVFDKASETMSGVDNFAIKLGLEMEATIDGEKQNIAININGKSDVKNKVSDMEIAMNLGNMTFNIKSYAEEVDGKTITYTQNILGDNYTKVVDETASSEMIDLEEISKIINSSKEVKKIKSDIEDLDKYEVTVAREDLDDVFASIGTLTGEDISGLEINSDLVMYAYINKDGYVSKMSIDMTDLIVPEDGVEYNKLLLTMEFSDLNKTTVTIPEDVKANAVEESEEEISVTG